MEFKTLTISFADNILLHLQAYCKKTGQKQTDVVRQAVYEFLGKTCIGYTPVYGSNTITQTSDGNYYEHD